MMTKYIPHVINSYIVNQRPQDGYILATDMCKAAGKRWNHYFTLETTKDFLRALSSEAGITASQLVFSRRGNSSNFLQGTWVHPKVAIHLAQWLSPEFAVKVTNWVFDWMNSGQAPAPSLLKPVRHISNEETHLLFLCDEAGRSMEGFHRLREFCGYVGREHSRMQAQLINVHSLLHSDAPSLEAVTIRRENILPHNDALEETVGRFIKTQTRKASPHVKTSAGALYQAFCTWTQEPGTVSKIRFGKAMTRLGVRRVKCGLNYYAGINLIGGAHDY